MNKQDQAAAELATAFDLAEEVGAVSLPASEGPQRRAAPTDFLSAVAVDDEPYIPLPLGTPAPAASVDDEEQKQRSALWEGYGLWDFVKDSYANESLIFAGLSAAQEAGFNIDQTYRLPALDSKEWEALTENVPDDYHDSFAKAVSADHAQFIRAKILNELDTQQRAYEYGGAGGVFIANLVNPEGLLMAALSGGASWIQKGTTLATVAKAGAVGAAENLAVEAALASQQETRDAQDVAYAAAAGLILGGSFGALSKYLTPTEREALIRSGRMELDALDAARSGYAAPETIDGFAGDSAGAAAVNPDTLTRPLVDDSQLTKVADVPKTTYGGARIGPFRDYAARIHDIEDDELRGAVGTYTGDPAGSSDGRVVPIGADEEAHRIRDAKRTEYARVYERAYKEWAKARALSLLDRLSRQTRKDFGEAITLHRIGAVISDDETIRKVADFENGYYEWFRQEARRVGVKGFEELDRAPQGTPYRPRAWNKERVAEYANGQRFGAGVIERLIARAFFSGNPDVSPEVALKVGAGIVKKLRETRAGLNETIIGLRSGDSDYLTDVLRAEGVDEGTILDVSRKFAMQTKENGEGSISHAKHRTLLDESASIIATDRATGQTRELHLWELLVNDAEQLADSYTTKLSGAIGFARRAGVLSKADHEANLRQVLSHYEAKGDMDKGRDVAEALDEVYRVVHGESLDSATSPKLRTFVRGLRDYAFAVRMNMAWMAQLPDSASWLVNAQARRLFSYLPELRSVFSRMQDGTLEHEFAAEIERMTGLATEGHVTGLFTSVGDDFDAVGGKVSHGLRIASRGTAHLSMLAKVQNLNQRLAGLAYGTRLIDNALGKSADLSAQRLASAGLDAGMMKRIGEQVRKHAHYAAVGKGVKVERLNTDKWDDVPAAEAYWSALAREGRRLVQEEVTGEAPAYLSRWWGKLFSQFRRFGIVSHSKQLLYGIRHRDAETLQRLSYSLVLSGASYAAQMYLYSLTKPEREAKEWREKYLSPGAILWGSFSRAGMFAMTPALLQSAFEFATGTSLMSARTSQLSGNLLAGVPAYDLLARITAAASNLTQDMLRSDRRFDRGDFRTVRGTLPYQNAPLVKQMLDLIEQMLPEGEGDKDSSAAAWAVPK